MMIVVDSNIWIALLDASDSQHKKALSLVSTFAHEIIMPEYVILEVCTILKQKKLKRLANKFVEKVLADPNIHLETSGSIYFGKVLDLFCLDEHPGLSFIDISLLYLSKFHTVHTFDKKLASAIKKAGRK